MLAAAWITAVATGLLAILAGFTAWYARNAFVKQSKEVSDQAEMLEIQRRQADEQRKINKLLTEDLRGSLDERTRQRQSAEREQADEVSFRMASIPFPAFSQEDASEFAVPPGETVHMAIVSNESRRPIKNVVCKAANVPDTESPFAPAYSYSAVMVGALANQRHGAGGESPSHIYAIPASHVLRIRPGEAYGFVFEISIHRMLMDGEVVRFTDDADIHWQIDHDLHLERLSDRNDW